MIMVLGEITTSATINYEAIIRDTLHEIGYDDPAKGLDYKSVNIIIAVEERSPAIAREADVITLEQATTSSRAVVFGYASDETEDALPLSHLLAASLVMRLTEARKARTLEWLQPYGTVLVTCEYSLTMTRIIPHRVHTVVISIQYCNAISSEQLREGLMDQIVRRAIPEKYRDDDTIYHFSPLDHLATSGQHVTGVTGRKLSTDTYGGWAPHSGGGFSGKDAANMERSGAYAARWVAKSLVHAKLCHRVLIQLAFAPGVAYPISLHLNSFGSGVCVSGKSDSELLEIVRSNFDLHPSSIIRDLQLLRPIMFDATRLGHFTPALQAATWEVSKALAY
mmetsp:Transcript_22956/g.73829  ORF Transcript_22956/g.73829 Transcript_22956/m.73829 type:complete len:337 (+) Transcript_22956:421-1431(+)